MPDTRLESFLEELKRRRVIRVATLYAVVFWPVIQIVDILSPAVGLPDSIMRYLVIAFVGGFPLALIFAWIFDINRDGIVIDHGDESKQTTPLIGSRTEQMVIVSFLILAAGLLYLQLSVTEEPAETAQSSAADARSIAVLPFVSFSDDSRDQFFADGLTEELLNDLASVKGLQVAARTSSFAYRGVNRRIQEIGAELGVAVILEGSVRRNDIDNTVRITAQLIDTASGSHLWSETYDRKYADVLRIQDEIAETVVQELEIRLVDTETPTLRHHDTASPEAMIAYGMGKKELSLRSETSLQDASRLFTRAIESDPNYAEAYVGLADAHTLMVSYGYGDRDLHLSAAQNAVDRALALNNRLGMAWATQGLIHDQHQRKEEARAALEKALEHNPSYAMANMWYAGMVDDADRQFELYQRAYELDPRSPVAGYNLANTLLAKGRDEAAMEIAGQICESDPNYDRAYFLIARVEDKHGRLGGAIRQYQKAYSLQPSADTAFKIARLHIQLNDYTQADRWMATASSDMTDRYQTEYDWLQVERLLSENRDPEAREILTRLSQPEVASKSAYVHATNAAYALGNHEKVIQNWTRLQNQTVPGANFSPLIYIEAALATAHAYQRTGRTNDAEQLMDLAETRLADPQLATEGAQRLYTQSLLHALKGEDDLAMVSLHRAIDEGWRQVWRPMKEPILEELVSSPVFQGMIADMETRMQLLRRRMQFAARFDDAMQG